MPPPDSLEVLPEIQMTGKTCPYLGPDEKPGFILRPDGAQHPLKGLTRRRTEFTNKDPASLQPRGASLFNLQLWMHLSIFEGCLLQVEHPVHIKYDLRQGTWVVCQDCLQAKTHPFFFIYFHSQTMNATSIYSRSSVHFRTKNRGIKRELDRPISSAAKPSK